MVRNERAKWLKRMASVIVACLAICSLAGCVPQHSAVGDAQASSAAHDVISRNDMRVGVIGSTDTAFDTSVVKALENAAIATTYASVSSLNTADARVQAATQAIRDLAASRASLAIICKLDITDANASQWQSALQEARNLGLAVALADPVNAPSDPLLYAATLNVTDDKSAEPLGNVAATIIRDEQHERSITVSTSAQPDTNQW